MTSSSHFVTEKIKRSQLIVASVRAMPGDSGYELKESYYKAIEGINGLVEGLEMLAVIAPEGPERQAVLDELKVARVAQGNLSVSCLGRIL